MAKEFKAPDKSGSPPPPKKSNTTLIIIIVVAVILICCCIGIIGLGWAFGDQILYELGWYF